MENICKRETLQYTVGWDSEPGSAPNVYLPVYIVYWTSYWAYDFPLTSGERLPVQLL